MRKTSRRRNMALLLGFAVAVVAVLLIAAIATTVIGLLPRTPPGTDNPVQQLSDVLTPVTAAAAFLGVIVSIYSINANLSVAQETQQAARFQKASELISDDLQTAEVAGVSLLQQLVSEDARAYSKPALAILKAFIAESVPIGLEGRPKQSHLDHPFPRTRMGIIQAVRLINVINSRNRRRRGRSRPELPGPEPANEIVYNLYLARWNREALTIRDLDFREVIASFWSMNGGYITDCRIEGRIGRKVRLSGTRLNGTRFKLKRIDEQPLTPWDLDCLRFDNCEFDEQTTINGYRMAEWVSLAATPPPPVDSATREPFATFAHEPVREDDYGDG